MHELCTGSDCVAKDNFPVTMNKKGILLIYLYTSM